MFVLVEADAYDHMEKDAWKYHFGDGVRWEKSELMSQPWMNKMKQVVLFWGRPEKKNSLAINSKMLTPLFSGFTVSNI